MPILPSGRYGKRSKPVRCAKAPLTRFGSVLRGTMRPYELHLWQLHCKTLPSAPSAPVRDLRSFRASGFAGPCARGIRWKEQTTSTSVWKAVKPSAIILHRTSRLHVIPDKPALASP